MKVDFNRPFVDLQGNKVFENIGSKLAEILATATSSPDPIKFWGWANKLEKKEPLELDVSDEVTLRAFIQQEARMMVALKAQLTLILIEHSGKSK